MNNVRNERMRLEDLHILYFCLYMHVFIISIYVHVYVYILKKWRYMSSFEQFAPKKTVLCLLPECKNKFAMSSNRREVQHSLHFLHYNNEKELYWRNTHPFF